MEISDIRDYCLAKNGVTESLPFNDETLVFKVGNKRFLLIPLEKLPTQFAAKADPEWSEELREEYPQISGAWHMNKTHWNTIHITGEMGVDELKKWIRHSVDEVIKKLPKIKQREYYGTVEQ